MYTNNKDFQLNKVTEEQLFELLERETNLLKNQALVNKLPDKGEQLRDKLEKIKKEIQVRKDMRTIENAMSELSVKEMEKNHVEHICNMEKTPTKERYKPFATVKNKHKVKMEKGTQMIPLKQSIDLLAEQDKRSKNEPANTGSDGEDDSTDGEENLEPILYS